MMSALLCLPTFNATCLATACHRRRRLTGWSIVPRIWVSVPMRGPGFQTASESRAAGNVGDSRHQLQSQGEHRTMPDLTCPHCGGDSASGAAYCRCCGRRIAEFITCRACREPIAKDATRCPFCTQPVPTEKDLAARALQLSVRATSLGAFFTGGGLTGLLFPPIISVSEGRIRVTKWGFLGLRTHHQEIQVSRVASVRYTKGIIWGGLLVETFGGATEDLAERGLRQEDARDMAERLKAVLSD